MKTVIFDLDGTLANVEHRRRFKDDGSFDWKYFNDPENIKNDTLNKNITDLFLKIRSFGIYNIVICTARMGNINDFNGTGKETREWLEKNCLVYPGSKIFMRKLNDFREDFIVKKEMLDNLLKLGHEIAFAVDDRDQVVKMWRDNGITCLQCANGSF